MHFSVGSLINFSLMITLFRNLTIFVFFSSYSDRSGEVDGCASASFFSLLAKLRQAKRVISLS